MTSTYNRLLTSLHDLNDVESVRPGHTRDVTPILGLVLDTSVQLMRQNTYDDDGKIVGASWYGFIQAVEDRGDEPKAIQLVLGDKAVRQLVRQWERLNSRTRPAARERARERALENPTGFAAEPRITVKCDEDDHDACVVPAECECQCHIQTENAA
jgi:hypothetical protein